MTRAEQRTQRGQKLADAWNAAHPIGTPVRYWTGVREGAGAESVTRSRAQEMSGHASVWVQGQAGSINLSHVEPLSKPFDPVAIVWWRENKRHEGSAIVGPLRMLVTVRPSRGGCIVDGAYQMFTHQTTAQLLRAGRVIHISSMPHPSWQAARAWAQRQARAWFAEYAEGGAERAGKAVAA